MRNTSDVFPILFSQPYNPIFSVYYGLFKNFSLKRKKPDSFLLKETVRPYLNNLIYSLFSKEKTFILNLERKLSMIDLIKLWYL